jgi:nitrate reductase gamma subunit
MHALYSFVAGPLVWVALIVFIGGSLYRLISMALLAREKDSAVYAYMDTEHALISIFHWIIPFASVNSRRRPVLSIVTFVFHLSLIITPLFLFAHVVLINENFNIAWPTLPDGLADTMTLLVIGACVFFLVRRLTQPEVKFLTTPSDFVILGIVAAPFITGFWAYHQWPGFRWMMILHILAGEAMLVAIPFTRLSHMLFFPFTRGYIGSEFGAVRKARDW